MRSITVLCAIALAIFTMPMFGAAYIKFDGIDGESTAAGHEKWIELNSLQFEEGACNLATRGSTARRASVELIDAPDALVQACASQKRFASVVVDADGRRHTLQNVSLAQCPAPAARKMKANARVVVRLDFATCADHTAATDGHVKAFPGVSGRLIGLTPAPIDVQIVKTTLRGQTATATFVRGTYQDLLGRGVNPTATRVSKVESITVKQQATATSVTFKDVVISSFADGPEGPTLTFEFETLIGSPADYLKLGGN